MKTAVGYIRVSTEQQADEGVSLDAQKVKIENWCKANDYELAHVYVDAGVSGKSMDKRTGLQDALKATKKDMALVVYSLSRLARSTQDTLSIADTINNRGADLVSITEHIDTTGAMGKMLFQLMAVFSEFERNVISERTKSALAHKKAKGEKYAPVPFGYSEIEKRLVVVEAEAHIVTEILAKRKAGASMQKIADALNVQGVIGKQGGKWYASSVKCILDRKVA